VGRVVLTIYQDQNFYQGSNLNKKREYMRRLKTTPFLTAKEYMPNFKNIKKI